ncbi:MAG: hypothetical protein AAFQ53_14815 [Bacteroidota bacterium]
MSDGNDYARETDSRIRALLEHLSNSGVPARDIRVPMMAEGEVFDVSAVDALRGAIGHVQDDRDRAIEAIEKAWSVLRSDPIGGSIKAQKILLWFDDDRVWNAHDPGASKPERGEG